MPTSRPDWSADERRQLSKLTDPLRIQEFLDAIPYSADPIYRCPRTVLRDRKAHCFDGAVFAAAALERIGHRPLIVELKAVHDDDHLLALFRRDGCWGAVAKSNFTGLRIREPLFRNLRELALSYFEFFYNTAYEKTLRSYSVSLNLNDSFGQNWQTEDTAMDLIAERLDRIRHHPLLNKKQERALGKMDQRSYEAGLLGVVPEGLYQPNITK